jgi:hypothetical protein
MEEIWRDIIGYKGSYQVSNLGRVKSLDRITKRCDGNIRHFRGRIIRQGGIKKGYNIVQLSEDGKVRGYAAHRLVAEAFIPNPESKKEINHKNGIKTDNRVENLEWSSRSENNLHAFRKLDKKAPWTGKFGENNPHSKPIIQLTKDGEFLAEYVCAAEAVRKTGVHGGDISKCCSGKLNSAGGYKWQFKET